MSDLLANLDGLHARYEQITERLGDPSLTGSGQYRQLAREPARLGRLMEPYLRLKQARLDADAARGLLDDPEMKAEAEQEVAQNDALADRLLAEIQGLRAQADEAGSRNAFLEIRAGTGGDEASLFAGDLA